MLASYLAGYQERVMLATNGNIFFVDYVLLNRIAANTKPNQQYLEAPMCLLYLNPRNELVPIAIQIKQEPGPENPIFLPTDSKYDWLLAKVWVRHADTQVHQLVSHLLNTHLFAEVFCIATLRKLPSAHPVFKLLMPHLKFTLHINTEARGLLISEGGVFDQIGARGSRERTQSCKLGEDRTPSGGPRPGATPRRGDEARCAWLTTRRVLSCLESRGVRRGSNGGQKTSVIELQRLCTKWFGL
ncbi:polyunsaturated fatty acid 5-lipoxygenase-like [Hypanus sabinus]|uniref:polyunsaturated fatty acid 5-lipoxygenase-like n=1 Tax=Hypanus sabinus TaxID=79690 RepID=UPI0028C4A4A8|nr:polyunsaturated fatty acid 5-lipoxygenase-like [Hypanus sabinus]